MATKILLSRMFKYALRRFFDYTTIFSAKVRRLFDSSFTVWFFEFLPGIWYFYQYSLAEYKAAKSPYSWSVFVDRCIYLYKLTFRKMLNYHLITDRAVFPAKIIKRSDADDTWLFQDIIINQLISTTKLVNGSK